MLYKDYVSKFLTEPFAIESADDYSEKNCEMSMDISQMSPHGGCSYGRNIEITFSKLDNDTLTKWITHDIEINVLNLDKYTNIPF